MYVAVMCSAGVQSLPSAETLAQAVQQRSKTGSISAPLAPEPPFPTVRWGFVPSYSLGFTSKHDREWGMMYSDYSAI